MKKALLLFCSLIFFSTAVLSQEVKEYFTASGEKTDEANSLYYRVTKQTPSGTFLESRVLSYYTATNTIKSEEQYNQDGFKDGDYKEYYENGSLKETGTYHKFAKIGDVTTYYPNGKTQQVITLFEAPQTASKYRSIDFKIKSYWDSLGNPLVIDGNGFCKCYSQDAPDSETATREDGNVSNGLRDGIWKGFKNNILAYEDNFKEGTFIKGTSYRGQIINYTELEKRADFKGGIEELYKFLNANIKYPKRARRTGTEGKVFVQFVIEKDGSISDIKVIKGLDKSTDAEAVRLVNLMPKWTPGYVRGLAVKSKFVLPLAFKLEY
jgi:TonB family protein